MLLQNLPDESVMHLFSQYKDPSTFEELVRRHQTYIVKQCYNYLKNMDDAKDISQEVLIRVLTKSSTYDSNALFKPWLNTIIRNRCIDHIRRDKRGLHKEISLKIEDTLVDEYDTDNIVKPTLEILEELLEQVSSEEKLILLLKYRRGWSVQTIQQTLNLNENTVKSKLKRSRDKLQALFLAYSSS